MTTVSIEEKNEGTTEKSLFQLTQSLHMYNLVLGRAALMDWGWDVETSVEEEEHPPPLIPENS